MVISQKSQKNKNIESLYPLSPMQEGLLFHTIYDPNSIAEKELVRTKSAKRYR